MAEETISEVVRLDDGDRDMALLRAIGRECGVRVEPAGVRSAVDPTTLLAIVTGGVALVALTIERWRERRQGGQVIDLRPGTKDVLYRDRGVLFGYVVIMLADGRVEVHLKEPINHLAAVVQQVVASGFGGDSESGDNTEIGAIDRVVTLIESITEGESTVHVDREDSADRHDDPGQDDAGARPQ